VVDTYGNSFSVISIISGKQGERSSSQSEVERGGPGSFTPNTETLSKTVNFVFSGAEKRGAK
jgi:hypothetical protein